VTISFSRWNQFKERVAVLSWPGVCVFMCTTTTINNKHIFKTHKINIKWAIWHYFCHNDKHALVCSSTSINN